MRIINDSKRKEFASGHGDDGLIMIWSKQLLLPNVKLNICKWRNGSTDEKRMFGRLLLKIFFVCFNDKFGIKLIFFRSLLS